MSVIWHVPGFSANKTDTRYGDTQFFKDGYRFLVIDGGEPTYTDLLITDLKIFGANKEDSELWTVATHIHYDHITGLRILIAHKTGGKYTFNITRLYCYDPKSLKAGLRNNKGSDFVRREIDAMNTLISEAEARGIKVIFVKNKQKISWGDIRFQVFRDQPTRVEDDDRYGYSYVNDGSLVTWFKNISYLTSGDGPEKLGDLCEQYDLNPTMIKGPHHGNDLPRKQATKMHNRGCLYYWDNDLSKDITDFLQTGREDAIGVGMTVMDIIGDVNGYTYGGHFYVIHKGKRVAKIPIECKSNAPVKTATPALVRKILRGSYGNGDRRVTKVLAAGYSPLSAKARVDAVVKTAKGIMNGSLDYGKNEERIKKIDKELGKGYGQLVQDYINVLAGVRDKV